MTYPLKHHKFIKGELTNLLDAGLIERSLSPYAVPIISIHYSIISVTKITRLAIDYHELSKQLPEVQTAQAKSKGSIVLVETAKIGHIWAKLKGARFFSSLDIRSGFHHISIHSESRPKTAFICPYCKFQWRRVSYGMPHAASVFLSTIFKFF